MRINPKYIQVIGDAVIPLLGFFMWNWSLYFILIFYFLDLLVKEIIIQLKTKKTRDYHFSQRTIANNFPWFWNSCLSFVLLIGTIYLAHFILSFLHQDFNPIKEILLFWNYKDMGIEQGYILVPLLILAGYMQYKNEFLAPKMFERISLSHLWKQHLTAQILIFCFAALTLAIFQFTIVTEVVLVLSIMGISTLYQFVKLKRN